MSTLELQTAVRPQAGPLRPVRRLVGMALLGLSLAAAVMLVVKHLGHVQLPGCGPQSGCAALASGRFGNVLGWPVSFLGTAYLAALAVAYLGVGRGPAVSAWFKRGVRLGALGSVFFLAVMVAQHHFCQYCAVVHAGNLGFWLLIERTRCRSGQPIWRPALCGAVAFVAVSGVLAVVQGSLLGAVAQRQQQSLQESIEVMIDRAGSQEGRPAELEGLPGFTGRYRRGPERAAIRLVVFSDYQCKDCAETEQQIEEALAGGYDISVSHKHFPLCRDCNRQVKFEHFHDHACRAARAAEAAGILGGGDAFWQVHAWLFERKAEFTDDELAAALPGLGIDDTETFFEVMRGERTLRRVREDVEEGIGLGITGTPAVYINGVELKGADAEGAVGRAVAALAEARPQPRTADADRPQPGLDRLFQLWLDQEPIELPAGKARWTLGREDARLRVVLIVDYQSPYAPHISRVLREVIGRRGDVRLELWHFPVSREFNPKFAKMNKELFPQSWQMTKVAEAAGQLGGPDAFWAMHDWLLDHQQDFSAEAALAAAGGFGLDRQEMAAAVESPAVTEALAVEVQRAIEAGIGFPPRIYVEGRHVQGMEPSGELLERILDHAAGENGSRLGQ